jgi:hypothetical protein
MSRDLDETIDRQEAITDALLDLAPLVDAAPVDKAGLAREVRRLAYAEGAEETYQATRRVASAAVAWGLRVAGKDRRSPEDITEVMSDGG